MIDAVHGRGIAAQPSPTAAPGPFHYVASLVLDEDRQRVLLGLASYDGGGRAGRVTGQVAVVDAATLTELARGANGGYPRLLRDQTQGLAISVAEVGHYSGCTDTTVEILGTPLQPIQFTRVGHLCVQATLATPPLSAPQGLSAIRNGQQVTITWQAARGAPDYLVEAGAASGLANLAFFRTGGATAYTASGVPPGTYFVRVRAVNDVGPGAASNEIVVTVP